MEEISKISGEDRFKLLPPDIVQKLVAAAAGIKTFEDSIKEATTETAALKKALQTKAGLTADEINYIAKYKDAKSLIKKLANAIK